MSASLYEIGWQEILGKVGPMLLALAERMTEPPPDYRGVLMTPRGQPYDVRVIPDIVPWEFCITLWIPGQPRPTEFIREARFLDLSSMERLIRHEGRHVDRWHRDGIPGFILHWADNGGRRDLEAEGFSENVDWRMMNDGTTPPFAGMDRLTFWMLTYAAKIDQDYHIRGSGIPAAYRDLARYVREYFSWEPKSWDSVKEWKGDFR